MAAPNPETLLKSVLMDPDADEPRLAYAAWCETQPDPADKARAQFIRLQLQLARPAPDSQERRDLKYRQERLETEYRAAWSAPLAVFTRDVEFDRGFVELVSMSARQWLEQAPALFLAAPVRHLNLTGLGLPGDNVLGAQLLSRLRSLGADSCGLEDHHIKTLAANPAAADLRWLSLMNNRLGLEAAKA